MEELDTLEIETEMVDEMCPCASVCPCKDLDEISDYYSDYDLDDAEGNY